MSIIHENIPVDMDNWYIKFQCNTRPHPNECSGSDLDGDIYFVCWDPELIPRQQEEPMDYSPAQSKQLDRDVTIEVLLCFPILRYLIVALH